jgi:hypothetical protein
MISSCSFRRSLKRNSLKQSCISNLSNPTLCARVEKVIRRRWRNQVTLKLQTRNTFLLRKSDCSWAASSSLSIRFTVKFVILFIRFKSKTQRTPCFRRLLHSSLSRALCRSNSRLHTIRSARSLTNPYSCSNINTKTTSWARRNSCRLKGFKRCCCMISIFCRSLW